MRVKRFVADTVQAAVAAVKAEFGPDALILETRRVRRRGLARWLRPPQYEVVAALAAPPGDGSGAEGRGAAHTAFAWERAPAARAEPQAGAAAVRRAAAPEALDRLKQALCRVDVSEPLADRVVRAVADRAAAAPQSASPETLASWAIDFIAGDLPCIDPGSVGEDGRVIPLIGPTGVGKTTTLAKLAANFALLGKKRVGIITIDTFRIGAVDQLRTYADLIGVPLEVVYHPEELRAAVERHGDKDLIFVDTAGRSPHHDAALSELKAFMDVLEAPAIHLVLSADTRLADALEAAKRFSVIPYSRLIVTKTDETRSHGVIYSLAAGTGRPVAYLTDGQNVPDDIQVADAREIARLIVRGAGNGSG